MEPVDKVWAVKLYIGNFEIIQFISDEQPPPKIFKLDIFDVDVSLNEFKPCDTKISKANENY